MNRDNAYLHSSPGIYSKFTDIEYTNKADKGRRIMKSMEGGITAGSSGGGNITPKPEPVIPFEEEYLTVTALEDDCKVYFIHKSTPIKIEYSLNKKEWVETESQPFENLGDFDRHIKGKFTPFTTINKGEKLYLRGDNTVYAGHMIFCMPADNNDIFDYDVYHDIPNVDINPIYNVSGNIMSLIYGYGFKDKSELTEEGCFAVFFGCIFIENEIPFINYYIYSAENMILPATALTRACYQNMFAMCENLILAPEFPATTLAEYCYYMMFYLCKSLTTAPELPAETLMTYSYAYMFNGCSSLNYIKCLATTFTTSVLTNWVSGVTSSGTFVKKSGVTWPSGNSGIPNGWIVEEVQ